MASIFEPLAAALKSAEDFVLNTDTDLSAPSDYSWSSSSDISRKMINLYSGMFLVYRGVFCCTFPEAGMQFDTFSLYFSILNADISAPVNPRGLKLTLFESKEPSDSTEISFNPSTLEG